jgi:hypothetical protein
MHRKNLPRLKATPFLVSAWLFGCGTSASDDTNGLPADESASYDATKLAEFRRALPQDERLTAGVPAPDADPSALTQRGNAELARLAAESAIKVNVPARLVVATLRAIVKTPPTLYDSKKDEFVWGPWDNDDGVGQALVYIRKNPKGDDFEYGYALVRLVDSDLATLTPVIWGGATPDTGVGVTLWDFEANAEFDATYDPGYDPEARRDAGRFAMVYGHGEQANGNFAFNVAVFRDFTSKDAEPDTEPADLDYFYGHFAGDDGNVIDFVDWDLTANLCNADAASCFEQPDPGASEALRLRAAFLNRGQGRAEAAISQGDLSGTVTAVECWDETIDRTAVVVSSDDVLLLEDGACTGGFEQSLTELGVPSLADVDPEVLAALDCVASNGVASNGLAACEKQ